MKLDWSQKRALRRKIKKAARKKDIVCAEHIDVTDNGEVCVSNHESENNGLKEAWPDINAGLEKTKIVCSFSGHLQLSL